MKRFYRTPFGPHLVRLRILVRSMSSPIFVNFGLTTRTLHLGKKEKLGQRPIHISPGEKKLRGKARWGSRNWRRRHCLRPYGGICVLQAC